MNKIAKAAICMAIAALTTGVAATTYAAPEPGSSTTIVASQPQVRVLSGQIEITIPGDENKSVQVYTLTGQIVKNFVAAPGVTLVDLPAGYYIVKCDRTTCRVVIR